jgi:hypothetical protein
MTPLDAPLLERTDPVLARPLPENLKAARADISAAGQILVQLSDAILEKEWRWTGESDTEIRYGAYRAAEALEVAENEARSLLAADDGQETRAAQIIGPSTAARWDLHGLLMAVDPALLDADPEDGQWTIRLVMGHIISSQRAYGWGTAWWLANPYDAGDPALPAGVDEDFWKSLPDEATTEAEGTMSELRDRLDSVLDLATERLAGLADEQLRLAARWSGYPVEIGFRLGRFGSHIREHTIQIEKTLAMLKASPGEGKRLARHVLAAYGRAESAVFGRRPGAGANEATALIATVAAEARETIAAAANSAGS